MQGLDRRADVGLSDRRDLHDHAARLVVDQRPGEQARLGCSEQRRDPLGRGRGNPCPHLYAGSGAGRLDRRVGIAAREQEGEDR